MYRKIILITTTALAIVGCKKNSENNTTPPPSNRETILNDSAIVINSTSDNLIASIDSNIIVFSNTSPQLDSIKSGSIIVSQPTAKAKNGYLRRVISIQKNGIRLTFTTTNAKITDLFDKANASYEYTYDISDTLFKIQTLPFVINDSLILNNSNGGVKILMNFRSTPKIKNDFNVSLSNVSGIDLPKLQSWLFRFDLENELDIKTIANYSGSFDLGPTKIGRTMNLKNFYFFVGGAPVVLRLELEWYLGLVGNFNANTTLNFSSKNSCYGLFWYNGTTWDKRSDFVNNSRTSSTSIESNGSLKAYIQPRVRVSLYDHSVIGVGVNPSIYTKLSAAFNSSGPNAVLNWKLFAGVDGNAFIESDLPKFLGLSNQDRIDFPDIFNTELTIKEDSIVFSTIPGLVAYYPFSGNSNDSSGNNNNGTIHGATLTEDKNGYANSAYFFNGASYISNGTQIPSSLQLTNAVSIAAKIKVVSATDGGRIIRAGCNCGQYTGYDFFVSPYGNGFQLSGQFGDGSIHSNYLLEYNTWYSVVLTANSAGLHIYVNGQLIASNTSQTVSPPTSISYNGFPFYIGMKDLNPSVGNGYMNGALDQIRVYSKVLTPAEILILHNSWK